MRIVIAEDLALLREGLIRIFQANGFEVVDAVDNGPSLIRALTTHRPDVAVVDVRLPPTFTDEGLRAVIDVRKRIPGLPIVVLSQYVEQLYAKELMSDRAGAVGYLLKDRVLDVGQFVAGVRQVAAGSTVMDPDVVGALLTHRSADPLLLELTPREHEVLSLMAQGRSNAAIMRPDIRQREDRQQAQLQHLHQTRTRTVRGRQPPDPGSTRLPGRLSRHHRPPPKPPTCRSGGSRNRPRDSESSPGVQQPVRSSGRPTGEVAKSCQDAAARLVCLSNRAGPGGAGQNCSRYRSSV